MKTIRIETKLSRRPRARPPGNGQAGLATEREDLAPLTENAGANKSSERNCSSSRQRPNWHGRKTRPRPSGEKEQDPSTGKDETNYRSRKAQARRSQADQGGLSEGGRASAASRRADGSGGQITETEGSSAPTRRPKRHVRFSRKFRKPSPRGSAGSKAAKTRKSRIEKDRPKEQQKKDQKEG